jgi:hypothetical protein
MKREVEMTGRPVLLSVWLLLLMSSDWAAITFLVFQMAKPS